MKKLFWFFAILTLCIPARAVDFYFTNYDATVLTNTPFQIFPVSLNTNNGKYHVVGLPGRIAATNGIATNITLLRGDYELKFVTAKNQNLLTDTFLFSVPTDGDTNNVVDLRVPSVSQSGGQAFRSQFIPKTNGTAFSLTSSNTTLLGPVTFGGETRTSWPTGGSGGSATNAVINATAPLIITGPTNVSLPKATAAADGYLATPEFILFSNKVSTAQLAAQSNNILGLVVGTNKFETNRIALQTQIDGKLSLTGGVLTGGILLSNTSDPTTALSLRYIQGQNALYLGTVDVGAGSDSVSVGLRQDNDGERSTSVGVANLSWNEHGIIVGNDNLIGGVDHHSIRGSILGSDNYAPLLTTNLLFLGNYHTASGDNRNNIFAIGTSNTLSGSSAGAIGFNLNTTNGIDLGVNDTVKTTFATNGITFRVAVTNETLSTNTLVGTSANGKDLVSIAKSDFVPSSAGAGTNNVLLTPTINAGNGDYIQGDASGFMFALSLTNATDLSNFRLLIADHANSEKGYTLSPTVFVGTNKFATTNAGFESRIAANEAAIPLKQTGSAKLSNIVALANSSGVLTNDGAGNLSWVAVSGGSSGGTNEYDAIFTDFLTASNFTANGIRYTTNAPDVALIDARSPAGFFSTNSSFTIGGFTNLTSGFFYQPGITVSNSGVGNITVTFTSTHLANYSTNVIPSGAEMIIGWDIRPNQRTNAATSIVE